MPFIAVSASVLAPCATPIALVISCDMSSKILLRVCMAASVARRRLYGPPPGRAKPGVLDIAPGRPDAGGRGNRSAEVHAIPFPDISSGHRLGRALRRDLALRWYALAYIAGLLIGWRSRARRCAPARRSGAAPAPMTAARRSKDLLTWVMLGVIIGGRLGFVLFYQPGHYFAANPAEILAVWQGGMSFHGGFLGVVVGGALVLPRATDSDACRRRRRAGGGGADRASSSGGSPTSSTPSSGAGRRPLPWGVIFPGEAAQACPGADRPCARHPSQLYEAALEGLLLGASCCSWRSGAAR